MGAPAFWLSGQEIVEIESIEETNRYGKCWSPRFKAKRQNGTTMMIDRSDIILEEEQALIDELAQILHSNRNPVKHERYSVIMRLFLSKGVPYVAKLRNHTPQQQTIDLITAG